MYDRLSASSGVDEARLDLFARKQRAYDAIPPTRAALKEHAKHAAYQAGIIWGTVNSLTQRSAVQPTGGELRRERRGRYVGQLFHVLQQAVRS